MFKMVVCDDGYVRFKLRRTKRGEVLEGFVESGLPKNRFFYEIYKVFNWRRV